MNKYMYVGLLLGLLLSVLLNKFYTYQNPSMVSVVCVVIGTFLGSSVDNKYKMKDDNDKK